MFYNTLFSYDPVYQEVRPTLVEIHVADIHFGAMDPKVQFDILVEQLLNKVSTIHFNLFCINGDLFHHKFMSNSDVVLYASMFIDKVVQLCRINNATLIILHGTASHDANQLKLFYHYLSDPSINIHIIENTQFVYTQGKRILCIPEEYNMGKEYYYQFLYNSGLYDSVCMHGTLKGSIYGCDVEDLDSSKNPVFSLNSFTNCTGPIIAGHVHVAGCHEQHMYYSGSPLRWQFGEEQTKGFLVVLHNLNTRQYTVDMQEIKSFRYDTINLDEMARCDPKEIIRYLSNLKDNGIDFIKVKFTQGGSSVEAVKNYYKLNNNITIDTTDVQFQETIKENQKNNEVYQEYSYIFDPNLNQYDILTRFINQQKGCDFITVDELMKIVNEF